jgi:hypothetical protein
MQRLNHLSPQLFYLFILRSQLDGAVGLTISFCPRSSGIVWICFFGDSTITTPPVRPTSFGCRQARHRIILAPVDKARVVKMGFATNGVRLTTSKTSFFQTAANSQPARRQIRH